MTFIPYFIKKIIKMLNYPDIYILNFITFDIGKRSNIKNVDDLIKRNPFIKSEDRVTIRAIFFFFQKSYRALCRFCYLYKLKKATRINIPTDLRSNELSMFPKNQIIELHENNAIYKFRLLDLMIIWKKALTSSNFMHPAPSPLKNPFTNIPFKKHNLYNIYFKLHDSNLLIPSLITDCFKLDFNIMKFKTNSYVTLKDLALIDFAKNGKIDFIFDDLVTMFLEYRNITSARIDAHGDRLYRIESVTKARHLLKYYYTIHYSSNQLKVEDTKQILRSKIIEFDHKNYNFGKQIIP